MSYDMYNSTDVKFHYEWHCDYLLYVDNEYIAVRSNWDCNAPDEYELVQAGPQPAPVPLFASAWDAECPF
jgi:hypothetical protein|tara:strand:+ start:1451 stop:1660 length:210 start_codon:yes stop_codon:yes gene_type:complete